MSSTGLVCIAPSRWRGRATSGTVIMRPSGGTAAEEVTGRRAGEPLRAGSAVGHPPELRRQPGRDVGEDLLVVLGCEVERQREHHLVDGLVPGVAAQLLGDLPR